LAQIFPKWTNKIPPLVAAATILLIMATVGFFWYYGSPWYTDVGYRPVQPVRYSHNLHAGDLGLDCRYCHYDIEISPVANIPATQICMNCHKVILTDSERLLPVRESWENNIPIKWVRVHDLPDYVYFTHSAHLRVGVGCPSCHGNVAAMEVVEQKKPLSMGWCLECHRDPAMSLRPVDQITNMTWQPPSNQREIGAKLMRERNINPPVDCSGCHR
jgi:hypothetical protein